MEAGRTRWTDERVDDLALGVRDELRELRAEMRDTRVEMREGFRDVRAEIADLRSDTNAGFRAVHSEISGVHAEIGLNRRWLAGMWVTTFLGFAGLIVETGLR